MRADGARLAWVEVPGGDEHGDHDSSEGVYVMRLPDSPPHFLAGPVAVVWRLAHNGISDIPAAVASVTSRPLAEVQDQVLEILEDLTRRGLTAPVPRR